MRVARSEAHQLVRVLRKRRQSGGLRADEPPSHPGLFWLRPFANSSNTATIGLRSKGDSRNPCAMMPLPTTTCRLGGRMHSRWLGTSFAHWRVRIRPNSTPPDVLRTRLPFCTSFSYGGSAPQLSRLLEYVSRAHKCWSSREHRYRQGDCYPG